MGMIVCPQELNPTDELLNRCKHIADENGGNIKMISIRLKTLTYTDVWYLW